MRLAALVDEFVANQATSGLYLLPEQVLQCGVEAVRFYAGYAGLADGTCLAGPGDVTGDIELSMGDWTIVSPLFRLYVERQAAMVIEASRGLGVDPVGRSTSEVASDIRVVEESIQLAAFSEECYSVGLTD